MMVGMRQQHCRLNWARITSLNLASRNGGDEVDDLEVNEASAAVFEDGGDVELTVALSPQGGRRRRRPSSDRWVPPVGQIPKRYPGQALNGPASRAALMGFSPGKLFPFFCHSFLFLFFVLLIWILI
jgi:hypothetical protein